MRIPSTAASAIWVGGAADMLARRTAALSHCSWSRCCGTRTWTASGRPAPRPTGPSRGSREPGWISTTTSPRSGAGHADDRGPSFGLDRRSMRESVEVSNGSAPSRDTGSWLTGLVRNRASRHPGRPPAPPPPTSLPPPPPLLRLASRPSRRRADPWRCDSTSHVSGSFTEAEPPPQPHSNTLAGISDLSRRSRAAHGRPDVEAWAPRSPRCDSRMRPPR